MKKDKINFSKGIYQLNDQPNFNFQLNRVLMWNEGSLEDIEGIANKIRDSKTWKKEMIGIGDRAKDEGRIKEAIAYYRMSEFFMYDGDPDKLRYYLLSTKMFYDYYQDYFTDGTVTSYEVPYEEIKLPVLYAKAEGQKKDTILLHGGNDSYMEELFFPMLYFAEHGFDVYLFEGPGQGGVMRTQEKPFTYQWERPVSALLDSLKLDDVTIIGASLGGMLAPRAAAFEKRIRRVIAWSIFPSFLSAILQMHPPMARKVIKLLLKLHAAPVFNFLLHREAKNDAVTNWALKHGMYAYGAKTPYEYVKKLTKFQMVDVGHLIDQDVLVLGANQDHFIDYKLFKEELDALNNVRSLTFRLFTDRECASNHCNVGNAKLAFDTMMDWIELIKSDSNLQQ